MPREATPRIAVSRNKEPVRGMTVPDGAKTPFIPVWALGAPQTTWTCALPVSTTQTFRRSALGWRSADTTDATVKGSSASARFSTPSTSWPSMTSRSTIAPVVASVSRWVLSQSIVVFMPQSLLKRTANERGYVEGQKSVMPQPPQIRLVKGPEIRDPVLQHRDALDPHAEGKALIFRRVDAAIPQHLRVHHAAAKDLEPVATGADLQFPACARAPDIDLGRGFGERKVARAEADRQIVETEKGAAELDQTALQMTHMAHPVDHQPLDLMKHRRVRRIVVAAESPPRHDDPDWRRLCLHRADLHRRGVGAQRQPGAVRPLRKVEGV